MNANIKNVGIDGRGGARTGAGRRHLDGTRDGSRDPTVRITINVPRSLLLKARMAGGGNASEGFRLMARVYGTNVPIGVSQESFEEEES